MAIITSTSRPTSEPNSSGVGCIKAQDSGIKARKKYQQNYLKAWENGKESKGWLCKATNCRPNQIEAGDVAYCKVCDQTITCGKSELLRHSESKRHLNLIKSVMSSQDISKGLGTPIENKARRGELKWATMLAEINLPMTWG